MYQKEIRQILEQNKNILGLGEISKVSTTKIGRGENHDSILVKVNQKKFVFRIGLRKKFEENMAREFNMLKMIPKEIAPIPFYFDNSKKIIPHAFLIISYVEGKKIMRWSKKHLLLHAKKLAQLHKKKFSHCCDPDNVKKRKFSLLTTFGEWASEFKDQLRYKEIKPLASKIKVYIKENNHLFTSLKKFSIIHGDAYVDNILFSKDDIHYIDWEWSQISDNAQDLAALFYRDHNIFPWIVKFSDKDIDEYLNAYLKIIKDKTLKERVEVWNNYIRFFDLLWFKRKIKNCHKEKVNNFSKKFYRDNANKLLNSLSGKFL